MKKISLILSSLLISSAAFSATTGTLLLQGQVPRIVSIAVTPETIASALDLSVTQTDLKVGTVNERSNSKTGYRGTVFSQNLGKLKRVGGSEVVSYTLKVSGYPIDISTAAGSTYSFSNTQLYDTNREISISYTGKPAEQMVEGAYQDTVTFQIAAI